MGRPSKKKTRSATTIGGPADFIPTEVPTLRDCLRKIQLVKIEEPTASITRVLNSVAEAIVQAWEKSNALFCEPVIISNLSIVARLRRAYDAFQNERRIKKTTRKNYINELNSNLDSLFDITRCRCPIDLSEVSDYSDKETHPVRLLYS